jgi:hypothetical protein
MKKLEKAGLAQRERGKFDIGGVFIKSKQKEQHRIPFWVNGKERSVYVNADVAIIRSINGQNVKPSLTDEQWGKPRKLIDATSEGLGGAQCWMVGNLTSRSPEFVFGNLERDLIQSIAYFAPMMAQLIGGDDGEEAYWNLTEWDRQNNFNVNST